MRMIESAEYYRKFLSIEQAQEDVVSPLKSSEGINVWPLLKRRYFADHHHIYGPKSAPDYPAPLAARTLNANIRTVHPQILHLLERIPKGQALVMSAKNLHVRRVQGRLYDPYLDPVAEEIAASGLIPVKLQFFTGEDDEYHIAPVEIPFTLQTARISSSSLAPVQGYASYAEAAGERNIPVIPQYAIQDELTETLSYASVFRSILQIIRPRYVVQQEYYNPLAMGLSLVCRQMGIPCVEYQHGRQENHFMYSMYRIPKWGFELIPKWFFTWGESSARYMSSFLEGQKYHRVASTGKPEFIAWARGKSGDDSADLKALRARTQGKKVILVPLMLNVDRQAQEAFREVVVNSPADWIWLFRQHPMIPSNELELDFSQPNYESELSSSLSLNAVLAMADHVIAGCSSVCLDAQFAHGIPVTLLGKDASHFYSQFLHPEMMWAASAKEEILHSIASRKKNPDTDSLPENYVTSDSTLLAKMLQKLGGQQNTSKTD